MTRPRLQALAALALCAACAFHAAPLRAQTNSPRLSDWLLEHPAGTDAFPLGLSLRVPDEEVAQTAQLLKLLAMLSGSNRALGADSQSVDRLRNWLRTLPVTGRVTVPVADARWLQGNPARDPILQPHHAVVLPKRPGTVTVIAASGELCVAPHSPGREALAYLEACTPESVGRFDQAWVAQPDGRVQRYGVAIWNRQTQDEPAPGAWIWGPPRGSGWPETLGDELAAFLATQGPAPDPVVGTAFTAGTPLRLEREIAPRSRSFEPTANDWGGMGLLQSPTARMAKTGYFGASLSRTWPYTRGNFFFQPFEWMEAGFRYSNVSNRLYGPPELSGSQSYKDKSIDVKLRLWKESALVPEVAVGLRDVAGTGLFSGEYVVANKRTGDLDWSLGMGWGYVGARANIRNPLGRIFKSFDTRPGAITDINQTGNFALSSYFRGPASLFGGVQYQTPWDKLILKVEYDGNDYQHEPQGNNQPQRSPFNFGLVYRANSALDVTVGVERGNTVMLGFAIHAQLDGMQAPKPLDPPRVPVSTTRPTTAPDWPATIREVQRQTAWHVEKVEQSDHDLRVTLDAVSETYWRERLDRATAVLHRDAPAKVERFIYVYLQGGLEVVEHVVDRETWVRKQTLPLPLWEQRETILARSAENFDPRQPLYANPRPRFEHGLGLDYRHNIGGPDGFVLFQVSAVERVKWRLRNDTWIQGTVRLGLVDNFNKFKYDAPSGLPRVRTFLREYMTTSNLTLPNLQATHVGKLSENQYYSVYGGYLEDMFGGVGGEWLYRPFASRIAFSANVNYVKQRSFEQDLSFRNAGSQTGYRVTTGHATAYWDTGWEDIQANLSVGRYLAKDFGGTLEVSRQFKNGVKIGAFATKTNVSAEQFGEGSFDKGIYMSVPLEAVLPRSTNLVSNFVWKPLTRDGGAMLARENTLYGMTHARSDRTLWFEPAPQPNSELMPADRREDVPPKPAGSVPVLQVTSKESAASWVRDSNSSYALTEALYRQGFRNIKVAYDTSMRMTVSVSNDLLHPISRAVGRVARTALRMAPLETREIQVKFAERINPLVTYNFVDLAKLDQYLAGKANLAELAPTVSVEYLDPAVREKEPLAALGDVDSTETPPTPIAITPGLRSTGRVVDDLLAGARTLKDVNWLQAGALGTGLVVASALLDNRAYKFSKDHANNRVIKGFNTVGNVLPYVGAGLVALVALDGSDPRRSNTAVTSLESAGVAFALATGMKYAVGRARPEAGLGAKSFKPGSSQDSFPSRHAILAWAVATPMALEYDSYWGYGAAAVASLARVSKREHWMSDVVAGSLLGYGIGRIMWESSQAQNKGAPRAMVTPNSVALAWSFD